MQKASQLADQAQAKAGEAVEQARHQATSRLTVQKRQMADTMGTVASAVRRTGEQLREQEQGMVADYAQTAAERLDRFSSYLRDADVDEMLFEVENFARRQPAIFLGGALLLGFVGARLLRASNGPRRTSADYYRRLAGPPDYRSRPDYEGYGHPSGYTGSMRPGGQTTGTGAGSPRYYPRTTGPSRPWTSPSPGTTGQGRPQPGVTPPRREDEEKGPSSGGSGAENAAA
jgi:hypothetical protein